jgi:hypothetical protein
VRRSEGETTQSVLVLTERSEGETMVANLPFALLAQGSHPPRVMDPVRFVRASSCIDVVPGAGFCISGFFADFIHSKEMLYVDYETRGLNPINDPNFAVMGLGICSVSYLPAYFGVDLSLSQEEQDKDTKAIYDISHYLSTRPDIRLVAHNVTFDSMVMLWCVQQSRSLQPFSEWSAKDIDTCWANWKVCTYGLYRALASEDWIGQKHGLKNAMEDLLGWTDTNEKDRDDWLIEHGFSRRQSIDGVAIDKPVKGEMWRVPMAILGKYCALDCEATMLLYTKVLQPVAERFDGLRHFHEVYFMDLVKNVVWQKLKGVTVDMGGPSGLFVYRTALQQEIKQLKVDFFARDEVRPHLDAWHKEKKQTLMEDKPDKEWNTPAVLPAEPKKYNISGKLSLAWEKWNIKREEADKVVPQKTARFLAWEAKVAELEEATQALYKGELEDEDITLDDEATL